MKIIIKNLEIIFQNNTFVAVVALACLTSCGQGFQVLSSDNNTKASQSPTGPTPAPTATPNDPLSGFNGSAQAKVVLQFCVGCHGVNGISTNLKSVLSGSQKVFPILANQQSQYITNQIADFISGKRFIDLSAATEDPEAANMVRYQKANLDPSAPPSGMSNAQVISVISEVSNYFNSQSAPTAAMDANGLMALQTSMGLTANAPNGMSIFTTGKRSNGTSVAATCANCHGSAAAGNGGVPRQGGQVASRIFEALNDFLPNGSRATVPTMPSIVLGAGGTGLTNQDMLDVAVYVNSLP